MTTVCLRKKTGGGGITRALDGAKDNPFSGQQATDQLEPKTADNGRKGVCRTILVDRNHKTGLSKAPRNENKANLWGKNKGSGNLTAVLSRATGIHHHQQQPHKPHDTGRVTIKRGKRSMRKTEDGVGS